MNIFFDKCFLNGKIINFKDLDNSIKYNDNRLSYTSLKTLNQCPFRFFNETWEDIGLSNTDNSAHGTAGHYLIGEFLNSFLKPDFSMSEFTKDSLNFIEDYSLTYFEEEARHKIQPRSKYLYHSFGLLYVSSSFDKGKYLKKIEGYLDNMESILYHLPLSKIKNIYIETGIYRVTKSGRVLFGKADLVVEYLDGTFAIIDHKSSFNTMYFEPNQLKMYAKLIGKPINHLAVFELSSGSYIRYNSVIEGCLVDAKEFISEALVNVKTEDKICIGEHCSSCSVNCLTSITDKDGYISI